MKGKKLLFLFWVIVLFLGFVAAWNLPFFLRRVLVARLEEASGLKVSLSRVSLRWPETLILSDLRCSSKRKERLHVQNITFHFRWRSLFSNTIEVNKIVIEEPFLRFHRDRDGTLDLIRYLKRRVPSKEPPPKRRILVRSLVVERGEVELADESVQSTIRLNPVSLTAEDLSFPPRDWESPVTFKTFVGIEQFPPFTPLHLEGWVNLAKNDFRFGVELHELILPFWNPYVRRMIPMDFEGGKMDLDGEVTVRQRALRGSGFIHIRGLALERTPATTLAENVFGISQEKLVAFLENSTGELVFPLKVSGRLDDPQFKVGSLVTDSIRQSLARTLQRGVGEMLRAGSGTVGVAGLEKRTKRIVKEVEKTFRLDWILTQSPPKEPSQ